jgi:uncharacterized membrane protein YcaP (DUF421 family)
MDLTTLFSSDWNNLALIILRTTVIYFVILLGLRLSGKREVGQMTPFDLVLLLLLSNSVQNAMNGGDNSLNGGIVSAFVLITINFVVSKIIAKNKKIRRIFDGTPTILIKDGQIIEKNLMVENITVDELHEALREHSVASVKDVGLAVLEIDGAISVLKNDEMPSVQRHHHRIKFLRRH